MMEHLASHDIYYPESDGQPMAETEIHLEEMIDLISALKRHFAAVPDVHTAGNQFLYYVEGNPRAVVAPGVYVVKGTSHKRPRRTYKVWEEGRPPTFILELTSDSTRDEDLHKKKDCYERIGVEEYFLSDPLGDYLRPPLQGYRLQDGRYRRIAPEPDGSLMSQTLGLKLRREGERLRLIDAATGEPLPRIEENEERRQRAEARLAEEMAARRAAEEEIARLQQELERARKPK